MQNRDLDKSRRTLKARARDPISLMRQWLVLLAGLAPGRTADDAGIWEAGLFMEQHTAETYDDVDSKDLHCEDWCPDPSRYAPECGLKPCGCCAGPQGPACEDWCNPSRYHCAPRLLNGPSSRAQSPLVCEILLLDLPAVQGSATTSRRADAAPRVASPTTALQ